MVVFLVAGWSMGAEKVGGVNPLKPPDRSTPRAAIKTFLDSTDAVGTLVAGKYLSKPTRADFEELRLLLEVPQGSLDMSHVAPVARQKMGVASVLHLYEVLRRLDPKTFEAEGSGKEAAAVWTVPDTEIRLVRNDSGDYLFSPDTVKRAAEFYQRVKQMPLTAPMPLEGISRIPVEIGGWMVPYGWVRSMPAWLRAPVVGQAVWKWVALGLVLGVTLMLMRVVYRFSRGGVEGHPVRQSMRRLTLPGFVVLATPVVAFLTLAQINLVGEVGVVSLTIATGAWFAALAWLSWRAAPVLAEVIIASPQIPDDSVDAHLIRIVARLLGMGGVLVSVVVGADQVGIPLYGVLAGLGVGGLALALAAQPTIENLIGGLSLFADKPMKVGDEGSYGGVTGTVVAIGIRSTRIRGGDRTITSIPNAILSKSTIVNITQRDRIPIKGVVSLKYETSPNQLRGVLEKLRGMMEGDGRLAKETVRVRLAGVNASSVDVEFSAHAPTQSEEEFVATREDVYLRVMDIVAQGGMTVASAVAVK